MNDEIKIISAVRSNYDGMIAMIDVNNKVYLGKKENYYNNTDKNYAYYDNKDNSICFISNNSKIFSFLYGDGWIYSQYEMLNHGFSMDLYNEFDNLKKGILNQFKCNNEILFNKEPFKNLNINNYKKEMSDICTKYNFKYKELANDKIVLCAKDTDDKWIEWIKLDLNTNSIYLAGNTDNCNLWFSDTRKDITPERIISFVGDLNNLLRKLELHLSISKIIDPEDWQEIANVKDAYEDNRYRIQFQNIEFDNEGYVYFTVKMNKYGVDGFFRIEDFKNGPAMSIVSMDCYSKDEKDFANAHWEDITEKLREIVRINEEKIEQEEYEEV